MGVIPRPRLMGAQSQHELSLRVWCGGKLERPAPAGKRVHLETTGTTSAHFSLGKASQLVMSTFKGAGKCSPPAGLDREGSCVSEQQ